MIILDTNVVSEPMKPHGALAVQQWLDEQVADTLFLTATSLAEFLLGLELLPEGKRKAGLATSLHELIDQLFGTRILPFDERAAAAFAPIIRRAREAGRSLSVADGQIAAIATVHGFAVATRDTAPFVAAGVSVLDPWE
ncbi:MAG: type II toxin-antitoxin system VapC family toxin [Steroidobacteraceae bacterium]